jgi:LysR family transcriptional regulator, nitrogen assimilation regulatory protein
VSRQLIDGSLKAYRIVTPRITRKLVVIHHPGQPMSVAATELVEILRQELGDASAQLQNHIFGLIDRINRYNSTIPRRPR